MINFNEEEVMKGMRYTAEYRVNATTLNTDMFLYKRTEVFGVCIIQH